MFRTYRFRIKDSNHINELKRLAGAVNFIWNYCNEVSITSARRKNGNKLRNWVSDFDLINLTAGAYRELGINSQSIHLVCTQYARSRNKHKRPQLHWRSAKRSLGWIPVRATNINLQDDSFTFMKRKYHFWKSRELEGKFKKGSFNQDAKGNWFINFTCEIQPQQSKATQSIGVDLGLKTLATCSDGSIIENPRHYQALEKDLATAQRAKKKRRIKAIHVKIANKRKDYLHKESTKLVNKYKQIFVGDVSSSRLKKTRFAKSVSDSGWTLFKTMLDYKAIRLGVDFKVINEKYSSVTCSTCFEKSGPSGLSTLGVREWECSGCGESHNRDINAAKNILLSGLRHKTQLVESRC